jgi:cytochrome c biogenesis protein CcmG, thiol:disulfide interchange protein DsbE
MKLLTTLTLAIIFTFSLSAQTGKTLPQIKLKDLSGKSVDLSQFKNNGNPIIISFWATWCKPCKAELNAIADEYEDWQDETGVTLVAVSIDDARSTGRVEPYVNGQGWEYVVLLDPNGDFKRAMNVNNVPHTFLVDGNGKIVWQHNNYAPGDEEELYEKVKALSK